MNQRELDVLNILWEHEKPMSLANILNVRPDLIKSTVAAILAKLLKEKLIRIADITYSGKVLCRAYVPTQLSKDKVLAHAIDNYYAISNIVSPSDFFAYFLRLNMDDQKTKKELSKIKAILDRFEKEI